ncbi:MAG: hypothetical protein IPJ58_13180 [Ardenticatenia bacterium]|nr:hypothetical protein [Ardenticatenia bacterium]
MASTNAGPSDAQNLVLTDTLPATAPSSRRRPRRAAAA